MEGKTPIIELELNSGSFRIKTDDAVYHITVKPEGSLSQMVSKVVETEASRQESSEVFEPTQEDPFYREVSQEMYAEIGRLARQLSLSIKDIPGENFKKLDIQQTGIELENAKDQLADIVQMTEKATMDIMDLTENMSEDCRAVQQYLATIDGLPVFASHDDDMGWDAEETGTESAEPDSDQSVNFINALLEQEQRLKDMIGGLTLAGKPEPEAVEEEPAAAGGETVYHFDLDVVFQTLYELCTNESVKEHIKGMRADRDTAFEAATVQAGLAELAPTVDVEDNFYNFPITGILKGLFQATNQDKYKQILKKMNQTAGSIFLDTILPVEGQVSEKPAAPAAPPKKKPAPSGNGGASAEQLGPIVALVEESIQQLQAERERLASTNGAACVSGNGDQTIISEKDRQTIVKSVKDSTEALERIIGHSTGVMEALSFQDLSGQRIYRIVRLISDIQVQLLSLLVSFGAKLKKKQEEHSIKSVKEAEKMAQQEVDKMLERVSEPSPMAGPDAEGRLNQDSVNNLLADLGF